MGLVVGSLTKINLRICGSLVNYPGKLVRWTECRDMAQKSFEIRVNPKKKNNKTQRRKSKNLKSSKELSFIGNIKLQYKRPKETLKYDFQKYLLLSPKANYYNNSCKELFLCPHLKGWRAFRFKLVRLYVSTGRL